MKEDLRSNIDIAHSLAPAARTASANGAGVDLQGYESAVVVFYAGVVTDGTHTPSIEESDDNSTYTAVSAAQTQGTLAVLAANVPQRVGYVGHKRYIRPVITAAGTTTGAVTSASVVRGDPAVAPLV